MRLVVSGLRWAKRHKREFDAVLTLEDPNTRHGLRFHRTPSPDHLALHFDDLDEPLPGVERLGGWCLATRDQVEEGIRFGLARESLLVHCRAGVGRSPAMALAILAAQAAPGREEDALATLIAIRPESVPNLHVVGLADEIIGCSGNLVRVVRERDESMPQNADRRRLNRQAHFAYFGLDPALEPALFASGKRVR